MLPSLRPILGISLALLAILPTAIDARSAGLVNQKLQCMENSDCRRDHKTNTVTCNFTIRNETKAVNGWERSHILANSKYPGPCIEAMYMDNIIINVNNAPGSHGATPRNASLHWHGIHLKTPADGLNFSQLYDGTPLTQCPIKPGTSMTYRIKADTIGTHFWHSHYKLSFLDGLSGPLVVHDPKDPYYNDYDEERVLYISDFLNETSESHYYNWKEFESSFYYNHSARYSSIWDSYKGGWYNKTDNGTNFWSNENGTWYQWTYDNAGELLGPIPFVGGVFNGKTLNDRAKEPEVQEVEAGKSYRFRLISGSGFFSFEFSIDNHTFDVIAADGENLQKSGPFNYIQIQSGERYDIIVNATQKSGRFWMRAYTLENNFPDHGILGVLSYEGDKAGVLPTENYYLGNATGTRRANCFHDYNDDCINAAGFKALVPKAVEDPDLSTKLQLRFLHGPLLNATRWAEPVTPPLFRGGNFSALPGVYPCNVSSTLEDRTAQLGENCTSVLDLKLNQKVRVLLENPWEAARIAGLHSIHLHGHSFALLGTAYGNYTDGLPLNTVDPPMRDALVVPPGGWSMIQFTADNPGAWLLHCHQDLHLNDGMAYMINVAPEQLTSLEPPKDFPICQSWDTLGWEANPAAEPKEEPGPPLYTLG